MGTHSTACLIVVLGLVVCAATVMLVFDEARPVYAQDEEPPEEQPPEEQPPEQPPAQQPPEQQPPAQQPPAQPTQPAVPHDQLVPNESPPAPQRPKPVFEDSSAGSGGPVKIARIERGDMTTVLYRIDYTKIKTIKPFLDPLLTKDKGSIVVGDEKMPLVSITDTKENIVNLEKMIEMIDAPPPQVLIEAIVVEESVGSETQYGVEILDDRTATTFYSGFEADFNPSDYMSMVTAGFPERFQGSTFSFFSRELDRSTLDMKIRALKKKSGAKVLSSPRIRVLQNRTAKVSSGQEVIFYEGVVVNQTVHVTGKPREVGVKLEVVPHVVGKDYICLQVKPEVSAIIGYQPVGGADIGLQNPIIAKRSAETELVVRDGETIEIGGLIRTENVRSETGLPLLMDIPLLGYLFKREEVQERSTEIVFNLTVHIIKPSGAYPSRLIRPEDLK